MTQLVDHRFDIAACHGFYKEMPDTQFHSLLARTLIADPHHQADVLPGRTPQELKVRLPLRSFRGD
jgi:hypothetical protein